MSELDTGSTSDVEPDAPLLGSAELNEAPEEEGVVDKEFFNVHDGTKGRLKGVYLDEEERRNAERLRATLEDREPDYENLPSAAGTPLVTKGQLVDNSVMSNPSMAGVDSTVIPHDTLPVDTTVAEPEVDTSHTDQVAHEDEVRGDSGNQDVTVEDGHPTEGSSADVTNPSVTATFPGSTSEVPSTGSADTGTE